MQTELISMQQSFILKSTVLDHILEPNGQPISNLHFRKQVIKGQEKSRMVPIDEYGRQTISDLIMWHLDKYGDVDPNRMLFTSH